MLDFSLEPQNTTIVGMTGSGKTTFVLRLMLNSATACNFVFDDENRTAPRLNLKPCYTANELENALATRWVVFNPSKMFTPNDSDRDLFATKRRAFRWFCHWMFQVCGRGPGEKIISLPEIWRFCTPDSIPPEFAMLMQMGRELNTHVVCDTQHPERMNASILGATTELVCFKLLGPVSESLKAVEKIGAQSEHVAALELGSFIAYNRLSGTMAAGKLF